MKFHVKFLFGIMVSVFCLCNAGAADCPAGCFCLNNGKTIFDGEYVKRSCANESANLHEHCDNCIGGAGGTSLGHGNQIYDYDYDDFSELWIIPGAFYGFINGEFLYDSSCPGYDADGNCREGKIDYFNCPKTYPHSANGSKALTDCFKYDESGNKVYYGSANYGNCNIDGIKATVENLQRALIKAAQDLQNALNKVEQKNNMNVTAAKIDSGKQMINSGIKNNVDVKNTGVKKSMRSPSTRSTNNDIEAAKAMISAGI